MAGCTEFVHFGQVSDRESAWAMGGVTVEQQQPEGQWKQVGETDGKGRFSVFKGALKGGGDIRLTKRGYRPAIMTEVEFLQQNNILMTPSEDHLEPSNGLSTSP